MMSTASKADLVKLALRLIAIFLAVLSVAPAAAQTFPGGRPVRIVVPYPPGGLIDVLARALAAELTAGWAQPVIVDNAPGAGTIIGAEKVAGAPPDGHTLLMTTDATVVGNRFLYKKLSYDPDRSLVPITMLARSAQLVLANPSVPVSNLRELVDAARRQPGKFAYSSYGPGSQPQLLFELLKKREGIDLLHIPYKGVAPALTAATAGEVQFTVASPGLAGELVKSGRLKALMFASASRSKLFPELPTASEAGYPYATSSIWFALFAPAGISTALAQRIHRDVTTIARKPEFFERHIASRGFELVAGTSGELADAIRDETARFAEMARAAGLDPE
jgi:tripartite-type tricarboxylate transporter receptor subunit TctC